MESYKHISRVLHYVAELCLLKDFHQEFFQDLVLLKTNSVTWFGIIDSLHFKHMDLYNHNISERTFHRNILISLSSSLWP